MTSLVPVSMNPRVSRWISLWVVALALGVTSVVGAQEGELDSPEDTAPETGPGDIPTVPGTTEPIVDEDGDGEIDRGEERGLMEGSLDPEEVPEDREPGDEFETGFHDDDQDGRPDPENRLRWPDSWGAFGAWDYVLIGSAAATVVGTQIVGPLDKTDNFGRAPMGAGWQGTTGLDDAFRDALRRSDYSERGRMRDTSDLLLSASVSFPFLFDALISAFWFHESPEVGRELALLAIEVQFVTAAIQSTTNMLTSRVRPYVQDCPEREGVVGPEPELTDNGDCTGSVRYRSFFSGHASQAFAGAVTSCVFHAKFPLYGGGSRDILPCVGLLATATATGLFRVMGDMHHITDVITGALVGSAVGLALPLLRMRSWGDQSISIVPNGAGLAVVGTLR